MVKTSVVTALVCISLLTGCATPYSEAPLATNFPTSGQPKLQATSMEIIVTISVADARQYVVRSTNIHYVADGDSRLYVPSPSPAQIQTRNIEVTGP